MDKLACFPITHDLLTVLKYKELMEGNTITAINSFKEDPLLEELRLEYPEWSISPNIEETLAYADSVLMLDNVEEYTLPKYERMLLETVKQKKKALLSTKLCGQLNVEEYTYIDVQKNSFEQDRKEYYDKLALIQIPVIAVCGMGENCSKFETTLLSLKRLKEKGYSVTLISGNPLVTLFGGYTLPEYLYSDTVSLEQKSHCFNHDVDELTKREKTDIILIELPGGIMPLGEGNQNHFSEIIIAISNALSIDAGILNTYVPSQKDEEQFGDLREYCDYRFSIPLEGFCMARQKVEYDFEQQRYQFMYLDDESYDKLYEKYCSRDVIMLTDQKQAENQIDQIIHLLEENAEFV